MSPQSQRRRLGRGLSSLIRNSTAIDGSEYEPVVDPSPARRATPPLTNTPGAGPMAVPIASISPNPSQPRRTFDKDALAELAQSIRVHGVLQPVLVTQTPGDEPDGDGNQTYRLIAGERRLRASELAGLTEIPCIVKSVSSRDMLEISLIENIQRAQLNPIERASAYRDLMDRFGLTQQQVCDRMGEPRATIANYLRLLDLCDEVQRLLVSGSITFGHAKVLAGLAGSADLQERLANKAARENLSVRSIERIVQAVQRGESADLADKAARPAPSRPAYLLDLERQLTGSVGGRVCIRPGRAKHTGRIVIDYHGLDHFDRIVGALGAEIDS